MSASRRTRLVAVVSLVASLLGSGCGSPPNVPGGGPAEDPRGAAALRYGLAPQAHPDVTFQPDVVIVSGGGRSIRSVTSDGLTWRIDAQADGADDLAPGRVMFVTGRSVGRVLAVRPEGSDLAVTVGPVDITEVIRDGSFEHRDVVLGEPVTYSAGDPSWAATGDSVDVGSGTGGTGGGSAGLPYAPAPDRRPVAPPATSGHVRKVPAGHSVFTSCCTDGVGAHFSYVEGGSKLIGTVTLTFDRPRADFFLAVRGGSVTRAELSIGGGFGTRIDVRAGTESGHDIVTPVFPLAAEHSFPIAQVLGVPISFTIGQALRLRTAFGARSGTVEGRGEFGIAGSLGYGYADGSFGPRVTTDVRRRVSLIQSLSGVPVGVMATLVEHHVTLNVGFNAYVLKAGVYFTLITSYGMTLGSALGAPVVACRGADLHISAVYGVGYRILEPVVRVVNRFLSLLRISPIDARSGIEDSVVLADLHDVIPPGTALCGGPPR